jgi:replication-associated recombination protein RarA
MRLHEKYRPRCLRDIVGQPGVATRLAAFAASPRPDILIFEGETGTGKTTAAIVLSEMFGCQDWFGSSVYKLNGADLTVELAREYFDPHKTPFRYKLGEKWHVLRIEELEWVSPQCQRYLKEAMEEAQRRWRCIVIATSNDASKLEKALRHRFKPFIFSAGPEFAKACQARLEWVWEQEVGAGAPMPYAAQMLGWDEDTFSMRRAIDQLEDYVQIRKQTFNLEEAVA